MMSYVPEESLHRSQFLCSFDIGSTFDLLFCVDDVFCFAFSSSRFFSAVASASKSTLLFSGNSRPTDFDRLWRFNPKKKNPNVPVPLLLLAIFHPSYNLDLAKLWP